MNQKLNNINLKAEIDLSSCRVRRVDVKIQCLFVIIVRTRECQVPGKSYIAIAGYERVNKIIRKIINLNNFSNELIKN